MGFKHLILDLLFLLYKPGDPSNLLDFVENAFLKSACPKWVMPHLQILEASTFLGSREVRKHEQPRGWSSALPWVPQPFMGCHQTLQVRQHQSGRCQGLLIRTDLNARFPLVLVDVLAGGMKAK